MKVRINPATAGETMANQAPIPCSMPFIFDISVLSSDSDFTEAYIVIENNRSPKLRPIEKRM